MQKHIVYLSLVVLCVTWGNIECVKGKDGHGRGGKKGNHSGRSSCEDPLVACQGASLTLSCEANEHIRIATAMYGNPVSCTSAIPTPTPTCGAADATAVVKQLCEGLVTCVIPATDATFPTSDCAVGTDENLFVMYKCKKNKLVVPPADSRVITCPAGQTITITSVQCASHMTFPDTCTGTIKSDIENACNTQMTCTVTGAETEIQPDTCREVGDMIFIEWTCA